MKRLTKLLLSTLIITIVAGLFYKYSTLLATSVGHDAVEPINFDIPIDRIKPTLKYDFVLDKFKVIEAKVQKNEFLGDILARHHIQGKRVNQLVEKSKTIFDTRKIRVGKPYMILADKNGKHTAQYLIYEPSLFRYIVYDLTNDMNVELIERPVDTIIQHRAGIIESSLWNAIVGNDMPYSISTKMEKVFGWTVDFHHTQKGDKFKLIYEELHIHGKRAGIGKVQAAFFHHANKNYWGYYYEDNQYKGYFDHNGRPMKKAFLKAPLEFSRISSPFNMRRFHPILRRVKPHLGTDYAAPRGTPILAVADGVVTKATFSRGNGRFVKIKHDKIYETQYLHMSKFGKGIRPGVRVMQGQVIGHVGSTGLATGPHVCFRFWKNGQQVDHRKENLPSPHPMVGKNMAAFKIIRDKHRQQLDALPFKSLEKSETLANHDP